MKHVLLLDGDSVSALLYARGVLLTLTERLDLDPTCAKSLVNSQLGGAIGFVSLGTEFGQGTLKLWFLLRCTFISLLLV